MNHTKLDICVPVWYNVGMVKIIYPFKVTYRVWHKKPSPWINDGKPFADEQIQEAEFMTKERAEKYIEHKTEHNLAVDIELHEGRFEVEEYSA